MTASDAKIPMLDLRAQHAELEEELIKGFSAVIATGRFVLGHPVEIFESELAALCDARYAITCNSGTDALWLALRGLGVGPGDAVLCPAYSFFASASTIVRLGARPVFCDILPGSLNLDPADAIRRAEQTPDLRAVISVDLFGRLCELGPLEAWCRERAIPIVEDAAQSIGACDEDGLKVGKRARISCLSFYPTKNLGALGDGGGVVTADAELAATIRSLRVHGESQSGVYHEIGTNSRLDTLQAVALSVKLRHLDRWTHARRKLALHYDALFAERGACPAPTPLSQGTLPLATPEPSSSPGRHTYHRYVVRVPADRRPGLIAALEAAGIASEIYYRRGLHQQPALEAFWPNAAGARPNAAGPRPDDAMSEQAALVETERASRETIALPLYPEMGIDQVERVVGVVTRALSS
ncbi:MAG: transcriptional regulator [Deltaproteobacteria bacterium]|nr:transcriptional regulator [Deltaproteobacteria bacterium]